MKKLFDEGNNEDSYLPHHEALIIKIKSGPHGAAHLEFNRQLIHKFAATDSADEGLVKKKRAGEHSSYLESGEICGTMHWADLAMKHSTEANFVHHHNPPPPSLIPHTRYNGA